jgi:hypothetical protein
VRFDLVDVGDPGRPVGTALVHARRDGSRVISALISERDHAESIRAVLVALESTAPEVVVRTCVPEWSAAADELERLGFVEVDADVCCSTATRPVPPSIVVVHAGLGCPL